VNQLAREIIPQKFERDFFERTYPSVINDISIAFSEIVAIAFWAMLIKNKEFLIDGYLPRAAVRRLWDNL
jgi:hypothetical protein